LKAEEILNELLKEVGMNNLEAEIYLTLLQKPGLTGYKIAGEISKATANTYKALNQLESKGLVVYSEKDNNKVYSVIDINEYMDKIANGFQIKRKMINEQIKHLKTPQRNFGNFNLTDKAQVIEKAKNLILSADKVLTVDAFPIPYELLKESIQIKESEENVKIYLKLYHKTEHICKHTIDSYRGDDHIDSWTGQWLIICKDGVESLLACFKRETEELIHAVWSTDPFISFCIFNGMANEFMLIDILNSAYVDQKMDMDIINFHHSRYRYLFNFESEAGNSILDQLYEKNDKDKPE